MAYGNAEDGSERGFVIEVPLRLRGVLGLVTMIVGPAFVLLLLIPAQLVPPVLSILSFVMACVVAIYALLMKVGRDGQGSMIWTIASVFMFTWIIAGLISNPKHVLDWFDSLSMVP